MKTKKITNKDFKVNQMIRAAEQRAAMKKASGKDSKDEKSLEFHGGLHKVTV